MYHLLNDLNWGNSSGEVDVRAARYKFSEVRTSLSAGAIPHYRAIIFSVLEVIKRIELLL